MCQFLLGKVQLLAILTLVCYVSLFMCQFLLGKVQLEEDKKEEEEHLKKLRDMKKVSIPLR